MTPIYFCHLPRTGGTTINHILKARFETINVSSKKVPDLNVECYTGHFNYVEKPGTWITFIRHPITRLESLYTYYSLKNPDKKITTSEFLNRVGKNPMSKQLGFGKFDFIGIFENYENEVERLMDFLNIRNLKIRHTHKQTKKLEIKIPHDYVNIDIEIYQKLSESQPR